jgi:hypothetical protein
MAKRAFRRAIVPRRGTVRSGSVGPSDTTLTVEGRVRWCNIARGCLSVGPDDRSASDVLIKFQLAHSRKAKTWSGALAEVLRPGAPVVVKLAWQPELDVFSPWQPFELVAGTQVIPLEPKGQSRGTRRS